MYAKLNKKKIPTLQLIALVLVLFQYLVTINDSKNYTSFLALEMLFIYGCLLVTALKKRGLFDLYSLLLCTMGLFSFGEIVFSFFDPSVNYRISSIGYELTFKEETVQNAMLIYSAYLLALDIGIVLYEKRGRNDNVFGVPFDLDVYRAGKMLMILFLAFAFYRAFVQFQILNSNRLLLFQGGSAGLDVPFYLRITSTFFLYGYYIFTASRPPLKQFIVATIVYVLVQIPDLLIGNRMALGVLFLYVLWMSVIVYGVKINVKKLALPLVAVIVVFQYIGMSRLDMDTSGIGVIGMVLKFLTMQATSFGLLCAYIQYTPNISGPYPFVLDSLIGGLTGYSGQTEEVLAHRSSIGHQLVYEISPEYYFSGSSSGTSCVSELYEFGILGVIIGAILFAFLVCFFQKYFSNSRLLLLFSCSIFAIVIMSPRAGMFLPLYEIIRTLVFVWVAFKGYKLISGRSIHLSKWIKSLVKQSNVIK